MTRFLNYAPEMVLTIAARSKRQISPGSSLAIAFDQPCQRADIETRLSSARLACQCSLIFGIEFRRTEQRPNACARPLANPDIPSNAPMLGDLSLQVAVAVAACPASKTDFLVGLNRFLVLWAQRNDHRGSAHANLYPAQTLFLGGTNYPPHVGLSKCCAFAAHFIAIPFK
jgi:hypothetical protein